MPDFYALVDAVPGREAQVEDSLRRVDRLKGTTRCKEKSQDFLVKFEAESFDVVDDFLQSHVRRILGVAGVEVVTDWDDFGVAVHEARKRLG